MFRQAGMVLVLGSIFALSSAMPSAWAHGTTERVSISSGGVQGNDGSAGPALSADGRFVAFWSYATNLVPGDTNGRPDIFVRDRQTGKTRRVGVSSGGVQGNDGSLYPVISMDGRSVAFLSFATNLVPGDTNNVPDIFVRDRQTGKTRRVSVSSGGAQGNDGSYGPTISTDGRFVAFHSYASNLVPGDTNGGPDVFVHDRQTGKTERVSVNSGGGQADGTSAFAAISAGGRFVTFESDASNLAPGDTNNFSDIFVRDRLRGKTGRVSISSGGVQGNDGSDSAAISADGRFVAFDSWASNLVPGDTNGWPDMFVRDRQTGKTERVSISSGGVQGNDFNYAPVLSADGRFVAFYSLATSLVLGDTNEASDVFVRDRQKGTTKRVSVNSGGVQGNGASFSEAISADGRFVTFQSDASNLVPGDTNKAGDIFFRILAP